MNTIQSISLSQFQTSELIQTGTSSLFIAQPLAETHPHIARQTMAIKTALDTLIEIDNTSQKSEHSAPIKELDNNVDELLPLIVSDLESNVKKKRFYRVRAESSEVILNLFAKRDRQKLYYGGYTSQGREISALFSELFSPEFEMHRANSGIGDLFDALKENFDELTIKLDARLHEGNLITSTKEAKGMLRYRLETLFTYVDANILDKVDGFESLETPMNELVSRMMSEYRARITRKENMN